MQGTKHKAAGAMIDGQFLVLTESEHMPDNTYVHNCGATIMCMSYRQPIWYPELGPCVGGGEVHRVNIPYCPDCETI
jgi:hypothetical protein